jgi:peptidoglycan-N-acetylglucosamine deacetylase
MSDFSLFGKVDKMKDGNSWSPYQGGVSLTFDDGTRNQLEKVVPVLDEFGFKGTFYINPKGADWQTRLSPWSEVAAHGHEIGNHTLTHPWPNNISGQHDGFEDMTLAEIEQDILTAQERLAQIAPHQDHWTFAYPCYTTFVGYGIHHQSYVPVIASHFLAGRIFGEYGFGNHPAVVDLAYLWGQPVERMSGYEMIGLVEEITARGCWAILIFHEIDGSRLTVASYDFRMLLNHLRRRSDVILTASVVEIAKKIKSYQGINRL